MILAPGRHGSRGGRPWRRVRRHRRGAGLRGVGGAQVIRCRRTCRRPASGRARTGTRPWRGFALMDRVQAAMRTAEALRARLAKGTERSGRVVARAGRPARACSCTCSRKGMRDVHEKSPDRGRAAGGAGAGARANGRRRGMVCARARHVPRLGPQPAHAAVGACRARRGRPAAARRSAALVRTACWPRKPGCTCWRRDEDKGRGRATARVRLAVAPLGDLPAARLRAALLDALQASAPPHAVVRRYRVRPRPAGAQHERGLAHAAGSTRCWAAISI